MNDQRFVTFTKSQEQLVYGSLLGDACLHRGTMKSNKTGNLIETYKLIFAHSVKQHEYVLHKQKLLNCCKIMRRKSGFGSDMEATAFSHTPTLREVAKICHDENHKKRVTSEWLAKLDWEGIAHWYMDDGDLLVSKKNHFKMRFHTESYSFNELELLQNFLANRGLQTRLLKSPNQNPNERIICSKHKAEVIKFLEKLKPFVIQQLAYKLRVLNQTYPRLCTHSKVESATSP